MLIDTKVGLAITVETNEGVLELPLSPDTLISFYSVENATMFCPELQFEFLDLENIFQKKEIKESAKIEVVVTDAIEKNSQPIKTKWRILGSPRIAFNVAGSTVLIQAIPDCPKYFLEVVQGCFKDMKASDIIQTLAPKCGIKVGNIMDTNDKAIWYSSMRTYAYFFKYLADHSFSNDTSCYIVGLNEKTEINLVDMNKRIAENEGDWTFTKDLDLLKSPQGRYLYAMEYNIPQNLNNYIDGYGKRLLAPKLDGSFIEEQTIKVKLNNRSITMNTAIKNNINNYMTNIRPIDCGNCHDYYEEAAYRNKRQRSIYNSDIHILSHYLAPLKLFDVVKVSVLRQNKQIECKFMVTAKTRTIIGSRYYEKYQLTTNSLNLNFGIGGSV